MGRSLALTLLAVVTAGCMRAPRPLAGEFPTTTVADAQAGGHVGDRVRWGGRVVMARPEKDHTCIEVVALPLDRRARPRESDATYGRFVACATGFYDPEVYAPKREVTVVGTLEQSSSGKIGGYDYVFPEVAAETIYLWRERTEERDRGVYYGGGFYYPWWGGWYHPVRVRRVR